jgi:hypothetical protein
MQSSWEMAGVLLQVDGLADVLGERHRIISNDWLAAHMNSLIGLMLARAAEMLDHIDFTPAALRRDLADARISPRRLYSTAELIARAADLCSDSAGLVHDNERRWRVTRERISQVLQAMTASADQDPARTTTPTGKADQPHTPVGLVGEEGLPTRGFRSLRAP